MNDTSVIDRLLDAVLDAVAEVCEVSRGELTPDVELHEVGVDSLAAGQVIAEVELALDTELPIEVLEELDDLATIGQVVDALACGLARRDERAPA